MKRLHTAIILSSTLFSIPAVAGQSVIEPQTQGEVSFVSGGIGSEERNAMQAMQANYNLILLFALEGSGEYLSDIEVQIIDSNQNTVLKTKSDGPMLFAKLQPGRYSITAKQDGRTIHKAVSIANKQHESLSFTWPVEKTDY